MSPISDDWYILYDGESEDGRGVPRYAGRTYSAIEAYHFYRDHILKTGPYGIGKVDRYTDDGCQTHVSESFLREMARRQDIAQNGRKGLTKIMDKKVKTHVPKPDEWGGFA